MIFFSTGCILLAVLLLFNYKKSYRFPFLTLFFLFISFLLTITYAVSNYFTDKGIDESVIYHLRYGLGNAGFEEYAGLITGAVLALTAITFLFYFFIKAAIRKSSKSYDKNKLSHLPVFLSVLAIILNPASENIYNLLQAELFQHTIDHADYIKVTEISTKPPLNLIYIYAESLEETYFDETLFPGLMPNLNRVRNKAIVFKDVAQVTHTGWTIAGMVASQCGVPLFSASQGNAMSGMPQFLSGATCLGDVLSRNNYALSYLGGASLEFAGKGHFFKTHGFSSIQGREELKEQLVDASYTSAWGLYDDSLFSIAKQKLAAQVAQDSPFALFMLTLDTHHPRGHLSASCTNHNYADGDNEILNAVHCSDILISEFIDYIQDHGLDKNTLIVIGSDHLAMKNTASDLLNQGNRTNMLIMIPPDLQEGRVISTPSSILDVSATILPLMGFETGALGFGRNILSNNAPRLIEQHDNFNSYLNSASALIASFWQYPQAVNDIRFDHTKNQAYFGQQSINYPVLFLIDDNNATEQVIFEFNSDKKLSEYLQTQEQGRKMLWIDQCTKLNAVFESIEEAREQGDCVAIGRLGSEKVWIEQLDIESKIEKKRILDEFYNKNERVAQGEYNKQINILRKLTLYGANIDDYKALPNGSRYKSIVIKSVSGVDDGESFVSFSDGTDKKVFKELTRGLNLIGFSNDKPAKIIHKIDTCKLSKGLKEQEKIVNILNNNNYEFYLLLSHDSTVCENDERLKIYMTGSSLKLWQELIWRQAYVSIIYKDGRSFELLGKNKQSINIGLR